ncbi:MAG: hypothetical protein GXP54_05100 [Deltaproteobacteria bacterium]|nr:hypothetical protein [Deltaproteobacteria bacterium]
MHRLSMLTITVIASSLALAGCAAGLKGLWTGSGEVEEGHFFQFTLDTRDKDAPTAVFQYGDGIKTTLAVCDLTEKDGVVEFRMDPDARAGTCKTMVLPYHFVGRMGAMVITGNVLDGDGKTVGMFRAFRNES